MNLDVLTELFNKAENIIENPYTTTADNVAYLDFILGSLPQSFETRNNFIKFAGGGGHNTETGVVRTYYNNWPHNNEEIAIYGLVKDTECDINIVIQPVHFAEIEGEPAKIIFEKHYTVINEQIAKDLEKEIKHFLFWNKLK